MRHASLLGPLAVGLCGFAVASCDRPANAPASPRTSEIVHLSQAPLDAVPVAPETPRPTTAPEPEKVVEAEAKTAPTPTQNLNTQPPAPTDPVTPAAPPAAPAPTEAPKPSPAPTVTPET